MKLRQQTDRTLSAAATPFQSSEEVLAEGQLPSTLGPNHRAPTDHARKERWAGGRAGGAASHCILSLQEPRQVTRNHPEKEGRVAQGRYSQQPGHG